ERFGWDSFAGVLDADAHLLAGRFDQDGDRAVGGRVAKGVGEQVEENALDLVGRAAHRWRAVETSLEMDVSPVCFRLQAANARIDEPVKRSLRQFDREHTGVDPCE